MSWLRQKRKPYLSLNRSDLTDSCRNVSFPFQAIQ